MEALGPAAVQTAVGALCTTALQVPSGVVILSNGETVTLGSDAVYAVPCPTLIPRSIDVTNVNPYVAADSSLAAHDDKDAPRTSDFRDPFYASTIPICYALAATTVTAWILFMMLLITPRSFLDGGVVRLSRTSFTNANTNGVSIGGRPWLQKVAALTVAISLTIATSDTFEIVSMQYRFGAQSAKVMQEHVLGSVELKATRLISDTFLWLAQAQTLIRLFPRQREKIIIKWAAFALITLDLIFSAINSFKYSPTNGITVNSRPMSFVHPVPALSYLFQMCLGLLYAAWVIYYAFMKRRYAFYHPLMKNICLVAVTSIVSITIPVVFFILDVSKPEFIGWGDYVRWVGAAAASVVVWEWVERIEALEREEKKDAILGREVFDGDDMLEVNASDLPHFRGRKFRKSDSSSSEKRTGSSDSGRNGFGFTSGYGWTGVTSFSGRHRQQIVQEVEVADEQETQQQQQQPQQSRSQQRPSSRANDHSSILPARPAPVLTPLSRTDTPSAASTVYAVRYQPVSDSSTRTPDPPPVVAGGAVVIGSNGHSDERQLSDENAPPMSRSVAGLTTRNGTRAAPRNSEPAATRSRARSVGVTSAVSPSSPSQGSPGLHGTGQESPSGGDKSYAARTRITAPLSEHHEEHGRWDLRARMEEFAAVQAEKIREKFRPTPDTHSLPVKVIPAPPRRGAALQQVLEEEARNRAGSDVTPSTLEEGRYESSSSSNQRPSHHHHHHQNPQSTGPRHQRPPGVPPAAVSSSNDMNGEARSHTAAVTIGGNGRQEPPLPPGAPPLWPGVQRRVMFDDEEDDEYYMSEDDLEPDLASNSNHDRISSR